MTPPATWPAAFALGLLSGMGPCLVTCLPCLAPVFLATGNGVHQSWKILLPVSLGRLSAYSLLCAGAGLVGQIAVRTLGTGILNRAFGISLVLVGMALILRGLPFPHACRKPAARLLPSGLFLMGFAIGVVPCAPLNVVLVSAAANGTWSGGLALGICFGLGSIAVPSLFLGTGTAYIGARLREVLLGWHIWVVRASGGLFLITGLRAALAQ